VQATVRAMWLARDLSPVQADGLGAELLNNGFTAEALEEGQKVFESGKRIEWRLR
jgi:hypothetical protein